MRPVVKDQQKKPAILTNPKTLDALQKLIDSGDVQSIREVLYQDPYYDIEGKRQMRVIDELNQYYLGKCAYCETDCKAEVEHYRPKKRVAEDKVHPGYYWLCYEWSNLIPSCHDCNTSGGKGNQFPILGLRQSSPPLTPIGQPDQDKVKANSPHLLTEKPYLLHPEIDDPINFLGVEIDPRGEGLSLIGLDGINQRGDQTIRVTNLNRKNLKINRLRTLNAFISSINTIFGSLAMGHISDEKLELILQIMFRQMDDNAQNIRLQHTLLRRYAVANVAQFSALVLPLLESSQRAIVLTVFTEYRQKNLL